MSDWEMPLIWRAAIYLSQPEPGAADDRRHRLSVDQQRLRCRCAATVLHAEVIGEFVDVGSPRDARPGLAQMLELAGRDRRLDYLIVSSHDRLARDRDDAFEIAWRLGFAGTVVIPADARDEFPWTGSLVGPQ